MSKHPGSSLAQHPMPWWRSGYLWLIIGLTLAMLAGGVVTVWLASQQPHAPVAAPPSQAEQAEQAEQGGALEPAMQARNRTSSRNAKALGTGGD